MALSYSNGTGSLIDKELDVPIADIQYQLTETTPTKYTPQKWWGEFSSRRELKKLGNYVLELEDGRKGTCVVGSSNMPGTTLKRGPARRYYYSFHGRGALGKRRFFGGVQI